MKVRWSRLIVFALIVVAILTTTVLTSKQIANDITLGLDLQGGFEVLYEAKPLEEGQKIDEKTMIAAADAVTRRVDVIGVAEPSITIEGDNRIRVQLAGVPNQDEARKILGKTAELTFRAPDGKEVLMRGSDISPGGAAQSFDDMNQPIVTVDFKNADKFEEITREYVGQPVPIYLDEEELSAPVIQNVISGGSASISGNFTVEEAKELASLLNAGALPVKLVEQHSFAVSASLGQTSLEKSLIAGIYSVILIFLFMIGFYRLPGVVAVITLITYSYLVMLTFSLLNVTLTLAGIAAFVLGIGMAVDANIIMYERIKEEMRLGKSIPAAMRSGSRRSFLTIFDANVTTILAALVLFYFGTAGVQGFAVSLIVSIIISFATAVALARILLTLLVRANVLKRPALFAVKEDEIREL
ncbi:protein translocase subunit SecD [Mechercharimyces sp. CAU 1602]|uniref:protein translocase subunit SecD n=1 Tax=Mechercharimyces sp. CAU 1602 TaxID=2973933 RepID=UPI002162D1BF|nr:protein translocase subunit SecD [Mechercharimyces sp. CAU 1602]MCS1350684.1 protein translocase subunit SecD [Mechercharimyces sp. CAU 1602]